MKKCDVHHLFISHLLTVNTMTRNPIMENDNLNIHVGISSNIIINLNFQQQDLQHLLPL